MCPTSFPNTLRGIIVLILALVVFALISSTASASPNTPATVLPAFDMMDIVHDRSRLIQFSLVVVGIGIALLWWGNKS
jgi:hypothetical protein